MNKLHVLEKLCSREDGNGSAPDWFHIGLPITNPPLLRGSILLRLNPEFIKDNAEHFECGSPVDTGALRCGLLKVEDRDAILANVVCDYEKFSRILSDLTSLSPSARAALVAHRPSVEAAAILERYFDRRIVAFMMSETSPAAWIFEFSLRRSYSIDPAHVEELAVANTYAEAPLFRRIRTMLGRRVRMFNPKYGSLGR